MEFSQGELDVNRRTTCPFCLKLGDLDGELLNKQTCRDCGRVFSLDYQSGKLTLIHEPNNLNKASHSGCIPVILLFISIATTVSAIGMWISV